MKFISNSIDMESNRRAVATCRAELAIAENLAEALKHEIEVRECHLKMAQATLRDEAFVYCERKVRKYRPELGTCDDEHWKVVKDWTGLSIVEIQPEEDEARSHERELLNLKADLEKLRRINESLLLENGQLKARVNSNSREIALSTSEQQQNWLDTKGNVNTSSQDAGKMQNASRQQSRSHNLFQDIFDESSGHRRYTLNFVPPNALTQARTIRSSPLPSFHFRYGITPTQALEFQASTKLIELANLHFIVTAIELIPVEVFQERTGRMIDCVRFRELFAKLIGLCIELGVILDEELEGDEGAYGLYMELRNVGGRAAERWETLLECEREFL